MITIREYIRYKSDWGHVILDKFDHNNIISDHIISDHIKRLPLHMYMNIYYSIKLFNKIINNHKNLSVIDNLILLGSNKD
jgi:hypothetical protein